MKKSKKGTKGAGIIKVINVLLVVLSMVLLIVLTFRGVEYVKIYLHGSPHFKLKRVVIDGNRMTRDQEILKASGLKYGMNIFEVDREKVTKRVEKLWWVKEAWVTIGYPDSIKITVKERRPLFVLRIDRFYLVDQDFTAFKLVENPIEADFPVVTGLTEEDYRDRKRRKTMLDAAFDFIRKYRKTRLSVSYPINEINVKRVEKEGVLFVVLGDRLGTVKIGLSDMELQLKRLELVEAFLNETGKKTRYVDLVDYMERGWVVFLPLKDSNKRGG